MKASEFRLGNLVYFPATKTNEYISMIDHGRVNLEGNLMMTFLNKIEPIPLTEEWLLRFVFEKVREYFTIDNEFEIFKDEKGFYSHINSGNIYLESVHQLQNLYFALTGGELTINK